MMDKPALSNKVFTENPLLDEIVYNARQIATGVILKDSDKADQHEILKSMQNGDALVSINNGNSSFGTFEYDPALLMEYYHDEVDAYAYAFDNNAIPEEDRPALLKLAIKKYSENYIEYNNYYRMLHGVPTYDPDGLWEGLWIDTTHIDTNTPTSIDYIALEKVNDDYELIHQLDLSYKNILYENGTSEAIINNTNQIISWGLTQKDVEYLRYIGDREIDYYEARVADRFALLYCPTSDSLEVNRRFKDLFEANRKYLLYTMYSDAYKIKSDYYDNFMMIFLIIQTIIDMIVELPEYIIRRDVFDTRTCKYIFESNGVKYFRDIPLRYQIALVKNLNKLIKFKSTDKCIVDIISIFGAENIQAFKYYILRDRNVDDPKILDYYDYTKETEDTLGNITISSDDDKNYDLKFLKVPILEPYDKYIGTESNLYDYDSIVESDDYWNGDQDYETVKSDIKNLDFTILRSKYYSIEAVIDLAKRNFTMTYFMNMMRNHNIDESRLLVNLPNVSNKKQFALMDVITTLYSLSYVYYGVEDTIIDSKSKACQILGFNMEADLGKISTWLHENHRGLDFKELHVEMFQTAKDPSGNYTITTFNQLQDMYMSNKEAYDNIVAVMADPPSKEIYDAYRYLYKAMMTTNFNMEYFLVGDNPVVDYYKELGYRSKFIYIPKPEEYHNPEDYDRDYKWLVESIDDNRLCFMIDENFEENHLYNLYVKNEDGELENVGTARMAYTYSEFLKYKDPVLHSFISSILAIKNIDDRKEYCINAIESIVSYLSGYIDEDGPNGVSLDTVFSGLPSISIDFVKRYVTEVIDFFKSFKIFTHDSSIIYQIGNKYDNYVQLIDHILLKYLFDKSELVRIEDQFGGKVRQILDKYIDAGTGLRTILPREERIELIDKVYFDIDTWVLKNWNLYYNSENYSELVDRIKEYHEICNTHDIHDQFWTAHYDEIEDYTTDAIVRMLVDMVKREDVIIKDSLANINHTHEFNEYYNEWITDIAYLMISKDLNDKMDYQDDYLKVVFHDIDEMYKIIDKGRISKSEFSFGDRYTMSDDIHSIITQTFPAYQTS